MCSRSRGWLIIPTLLICAAHAFANAPIGNSTFHFTTPKFGGNQPKTNKLTIAYDSNAGNARLVLPAETAALLRSAGAPRGSAALPTMVLGLALASVLLVGGFLVIRRPRVKFALSLLLPFGIALIGMAVHAQTARIEAPQTTIESGKIHISRGSGAELQLILPKRPR